MCASRGSTTEDSAARKSLLEPSPSRGRQGQQSLQTHHANHRLLGVDGAVKGGSQRSASEAGVERQCESTITVLEDVSSSGPRGRVHSSSEGLAYSDKGELSSESAPLAGQLFQPCRCKAQGSIGRFFALAKDATDSQTAQYPEVAERRQRAAER